MRINAVIIPLLLTNKITALVLYHIIIRLRLRDSVPPMHVKLFRMPIQYSTSYARDRACEIKLTINWVRDGPR